MRRLLNTYTGDVVEVHFVTREHHNKLDRFFRAPLSALTVRRKKDVEEIARQIVLEPGMEIRML